MIPTDWSYIDPDDGIDIQDGANLAVAGWIVALCAVAAALAAVLLARRLR